MKWEITYWLEGKQVRSYAGKTQDQWNRLPRARVLWIDFSYNLTNAAKQYRMRVKGLDNYYISGAYFGGWQDEDSPYGSGRVDWIYEENKIKMAPAQFPDEEAVKQGIMVPDTLSDYFGFTGPDKWQPSTLIT